MLLGLGPHEPEELKSPTCIKLEVGPTAKPEFPGAHETGGISRGGWVSGGCWQNKGKSVKFY